MNLLWTNHNPDPNTICKTCAYFIDKVFDPVLALPLPAHLGCYCTYFPTDQKPDKWNWETVPAETRQHWVRYVAWLLRTGATIPIVLKPLLQEARKYNRRREEEEEEETLNPMPNKSQPAQNATIRPIEATIHAGSVRLNTSTELDQERGSGSEVPTRREYDCIFIRAGRVRRTDGTDSNWLIPSDPLRAAVHLFDGLACYCDHPELFGFGWHQAPRTDRLIGVTSDPAWDEDLDAVTGTITLYDENPNALGAIIGDLWDQILADQSAGKAVPQAGLSATLWHTTNLDEESGLTATTEITKADSVDFVYSPGAGGYIRSALEAIHSTYASLPGAPPVNCTAAPQHPTGGFSMPPRVQNPEAPAEVQPAPIAGAAPQEQIASTRFDELEAHIATISNQIQSLIAAVSTEPDVSQQPEHPVQLAAFQARLDQIEALAAEQLADKTIEGMGQPTGSQAWHMRSSLDQVQLALDAMLDGVRPPDNIRPLSGIRELYHLLSGDFEFTGLFNAERVYLANVTSSTMANVTADALNKRVMNEFQKYPQWWLPIMSPQNFNSLQDIEWITLGGVGELPTVTAGAAYTEMTWDDIQQKSSFVKKGGYLGLTIEAIDKDDTRHLQSAPRALAQAAWLTLSKAISAIFTVSSGTGPSVYYDDSNTRVLFHTSNANLGTAALSWSAWVATRTAMRKQTEHNSDERLGALTAPRFLLVPSDLEMTGVQILASAGEPGTADNDVNPEAQGSMRDERLRIARSRVIVVDLWTDTNNWAAVADPQLYPTLGLGFRWGNTPEIFAVASPTAGLMFSNDVMPIKVRFFFATGPIDYRGLYKHNVS